MFPESLSVLGPSWAGRHAVNRPLMPGVMMLCQSLQGSWEQRGGCSSPGAEGAGYKMTRREEMGIKRGCKKGKKESFVGPCDSQ